MFKNVQLILCGLIFTACANNNKELDSDENQLETVENSTAGWDDNFSQRNLPHDSTYYRLNFDQNGEAGYLNYLGDTVIPFGKYPACFTGTFATSAKVLIPNDGLYAIDKKETKIFEIYWFDNGPDYTVEGLYRIKDGDKIGYANDNYEIVIKPQFSCAFPFENGRAKVTYDCELIPDGEYTAMESETWFYIDKNGTKIKE